MGVHLTPSPLGRSRVKLTQAFDSYHVSNGSWGRAHSTHKAAGVEVAGVTSHSWEETLR